MLAREQVDEPEAGVVARRFVFGPRVPEADDQVDWRSHVRRSSNPVRMIAQTEKPPCGGLSCRREKRAGCSYFLPSGLPPFASGLAPPLASPFAASAPAASPSFPGSTCAVAGTSPA